MTRYTLLLLCCVGCASAPSAPVSEPTSVKVPAPVPPTADKPGFYQGYAVVSKFDCTTHRFQRAGSDSVSAQITVVVTGNEIRATVSINGEERPVDVFLFSQKGYYLGNDGVSYAYFSADYNSITWGCQSPGDPNLYKTIYASR
jgi:hypothetical protein